MSHLPRRRWTWWDHLVAKLTGHVSRRVYNDRLSALNDRLSTLYDRLDTLERARRDAAADTLAQVLAQWSRDMRADGYASNGPQVEIFDILTRPSSEAQKQKRDALVDAVLGTDPSAHQVGLATGSHPLSGASASASEGRHLTR